MQGRALSVCLSVCGLGPGPALQQIPFHGTFRVCLPLALPLPSLCPRPASLLAPQHKGKVNHDAGLDWGIPKRCDWRSQEMVTHAEPVGVGMGKWASMHILEPRFVWDNPKFPVSGSGDAPSWCLGAVGGGCPKESGLFQR